MLTHLYRLRVVHRRQYRPEHQVCKTNAFLRLVNQKRLQRLCTLRITLAQACLRSAALGLFRWVKRNLFRVSAASSGEVEQVGAELRNVELDLSREALVHGVERREDLRLVLTSVQG